MRVGPALVMLVPLLALLPACSEQAVSLTTGVREYVASDYPQVLKRWTRSENLVAIGELNDLLTVTATFESWDFRWSYVIRYATDYRLTVEQRRTLLERTLSETRTRHQFFVALYGSQWRWTDLTRPDSAWIVRLIDEKGNETAPSAIELIPRPGALERTYFPYDTVWRQAFRVQFPTTTAPGRPTIAGDAKWFGLRFAGAEGNQELHWDIESSDAKKTAFGERKGDRRLAAQLLTAGEQLE